MRSERGLRVVLAGLVLGAFVVAVAGCRFGGQGKITLGYLTWDENVAVSNLTKVLLERELGYESVELKRAEDVGPVYEMVASSEADAFQDAWMPNHTELLRGVEDDVELLDPWFTGKTRFSVATPGYMHVSSIGGLADTNAEYIFGIEPGTTMMKKLPAEVIPGYDLDQKLVQADTEAMLAEVEKRYRNREEFAFVAWSPHWMNEVYDFDYLKDPKRELGNLTQPSDVGTLVRENLKREDPVAYAFMDSLKLDERQVGELEVEINAAEDPIEGVEAWLADNRRVVKPWIEAAEKAGEG